MTNCMRDAWLGSSYFQDNYMTGKLSVPDHLVTVCDQASKIATYLCRPTYDQVNSRVRNVCEIHGYST